MMTYFSLLDRYGGVRAAHPIELMIYWALSIIDYGLVIVLVDTAAAGRSASLYVNAIIAVLGLSLASYYLPKYYPWSEPYLIFLWPIYYGELTSKSAWSAYVRLMGESGTAVVTAPPISELLMIAAAYAAILAALSYAVMRARLKRLSEAS